MSFDEISTNQRRGRGS